MSRQVAGQGCLPRAATGPPQPASLDADAHAEGGGGDHGAWSLDLTGAAWGRGCGRSGQPLWENKGKARGRAEADHERRACPRLRSPSGAQGRWVPLLAPASGNVPQRPTEGTGCPGRRCPHKAGARLPRRGQCLCNGDHAGCLRHQAGWVRRLRASPVFRDPIQGPHPRALPAQREPCPQSPSRTARQ